MPRSTWVRYAEWARKLARWIRAHGCPRWTCHVARHTFATTVLKQQRVFDAEAGGWRRLTLFDLQRLMGHASIKTTERYYLGH